MKIKVEDNKIVGYARVGDIPGSIEIAEDILPENFFDGWAAEKWLYTDGTITENPDYTPPAPPEPTPSLEEQIAELKAQNDELIECILEMSEIVYGGDQ